MSKEKEYISDDDVVVIGGSDWHPEKKPGNTKRWKIIAFVLACMLALLVMFYVGRHILHSREFVQSRTADDVITSLASPMKGNAGVTPLSDESRGVKLKIYRLNGLKAHFADTVPDYNDSTIYLVTRSSDYKLINDRKESDSGIALHRACQCVNHVIRSA